jgi:hypothetical protein
MRDMGQRREVDAENIPPKIAAPYRAAASDNPVLGGICAFHTLPGSRVSGSRRAVMIILGCYSGRMAS